MTVDNKQQLQQHQQHWLTDNITDLHVLQYMIKLIINTLYHHLDEIRFHQYCQYCFYLNLSSNKVCKL